MRPGRSRFKLWMSLRSDVIGVNRSGQLDKFYEITFGVYPREHETALDELIAVEIIHLIPMAVPLGNFTLAI